MSRFSANKFAERLTDLLGFYQVSPEELPRDAGVETRDIIIWTQGEVPRDLEALDRVANMLGVSSKYLLTGFEPRRDMGGVVSESSDRSGYYGHFLRIDGGLPT